MLESYHVCGNVIMGRLFGAVRKHPRYRAWITFPAAVELLRAMPYGWVFQLLAWQGETAVGRGGLSILTNIGLPELVAKHLMIMFGSLPPVRKIFPGWRSYEVQCGRAC